MKKESRGIGEIIRELRRDRGMTQMQLSEMIGVSYQQIQKYEKSSDTISVQRLKQLARAFDVSLGVFFTADTRMAAETPAVYRRPEDELLVLEYYRNIKDKKTRSAVLEFLKILAT